MADVANYTAKVLRKRLQSIGFCLPNEIKLRGKIITFMAIYFMTMNLMAAIKNWSDFNLRFLAFEDFFANMAVSTFYIELLVSPKTMETLIQISDSRFYVSEYDKNLSIEKKKLIELCAADDRQWSDKITFGTKFFVVNIIIEKIIVRYILLAIKGFDSVECCLFSVNTHTRLVTRPR